MLKIQSQITTEEVCKIIQNPSNKKSARIDMISQQLLKENKEELKHIITKLINLSISEQTYPDCLKIAKVIPIHKNGKTNERSNYRPISLLSSFNKIFEQIIQSKLIAFIENNNILFNQQYGFRKYHSTIDALTVCHDFIIENLNNKKCVLGIFIDLKKHLTV